MGTIKKRKTHYTPKDTEETKDLSGLRGSVIAICCGDLHFSHKPPIARSVEEDWYGVMDGYIKQLRDLKEKFNCPILCAGDVFDKWNSPPELINFLIATLPTIFAIPGQHDLPNHSYERIEESAYWSLVLAGIIENVGVEPVRFDYHIKSQTDWYVTGAPWGFDIENVGMPNQGIGKHVALIHSYIWMKGKGFRGAPRENKIFNWLPKLKGYTAAIFGDNHMGFARGIEGKPPFIFNCGGFMRRKIDEKSYYPQVGLLMEGGAVLPYPLDVAGDKFIDIAEAEKLAEMTLDATAFLQEFGQLTGKAIYDYCRAVEQFCEKNGVAKEIRAKLSELMEK